jgi:hypothetical protein
MPGQEALVLPCLAEVLGLARTLMEDRELVMDSLGAARRLFTARRNATSASGVAAQVYELERRSASANSFLSNSSSRSTDHPKWHSDPHESLYQNARVALGFW